MSDTYTEILAKLREFETATFSNDPELKDALATFTYDAIVATLTKLAAFENCASGLLPPAEIRTEKKPVIELADGVRRQGNAIFVPNSHKKWPGLRGSQNFLPTAGGLLVALKDLDDSQRGALGLPRRGDPE